MSDGLGWRCLKFFVACLIIISLVVAFATYFDRLDRVEVEKSEPAKLYHEPARLYSKPLQNSPKWVDMYITYPDATTKCVVVVASGRANLDCDFNYGK